MGATPQGDYDKNSNELIHIKWIVEAVVLPQLRILGLT